MYSRNFLSLRSHCHSLHLSFWLSLSFIVGTGPDRTCWSSPHRRCLSLYEVEQTQALSLPNGKDPQYLMQMASGSMVTTSKFWSML